jgi:hypothetical protein
MPPKKRKAAGAEGDGVPRHQYMWLLMYRYGSQDLEEGYAVFSSKENAIAGLTEFMDKYGSIFGGDWMNGLEGFGKEDEENYFGFEYFGDSVGDDGVLLETDTESRDGDPCTVHLKRLKLDDPKGMEAQIVTNPYHS